MSDATSDRANMVRSLIAWAVALVAAIVIAVVVGRLFGLGTAPALVFAAATFLVVPYLIPLGRKAPDAYARSESSVTQQPPHEHRHVEPAPEPAAAHLAEMPVAETEVVAVETEVVAAPLHEDAAPVAPGVAISERVREAARAAGEAARAAVGDVAAERPAAMDAPRGGSADDLKRIKGVGPKLEALLHGLGIYHFDQIAGWGPAEVAWMDSNLEGFQGRVTRDTWVEQSRLLAAGGETEFSQRVDRGEVY